MAYKYVGAGNGRGREHVNIAEKALGRKLPPKAIVHHADNNDKDNSPENLVICPSQKYHLLLHMRMRALAACGNPSYKQCTFCKSWVDPEALDIGQNRPARGDATAFHRACVNAYNKEARKRRLGI